MRDLIVFVIVFGVLPFVLVRPYVGILLWSWIGYMNPHRLGYGAAVDFPFSAIIGVATLVAVLFSKESKKVPLTPITIVLGLFVLWMNITTFFALVPDNAWEQWDKVMKIQLMVLITLMVMNNKERINMLVWIIVISIGFYGVKGGIFTVASGGKYMVLGPEGSFFSGNTTLALVLIMVLPLMRYLQVNNNNKWVRRCFGVAMLLMAASIVGSYSRGAFLAGAAIALYLWVKGRRKAQTAIVLLLLLPALFVFMPDQWHKKMGTIQTYDEDASALGRINAWWFAFNVAKERPLVGGGYDAFSPVLFKTYAPNPNDFHDAHSIYFEVLGEHGFVGLALFLLLGFLTWKTAGWTIRKSKGHAEIAWCADLAAMIQVSIIGYAVGGAFLGLAYFDLYYHLVVIIVLLQRIVKQHIAAVEEGDEKGINGLSKVRRNPRYVYD